tara:strand:- start:8876 stop:9295 length:420 start_codon:yes stop_codon:yes gene_type:complete
MSRLRGLIAGILTTSVQSLWSAYTEAANQWGHVALGLLFGLVPAHLGGWWGACAGLGVSAVWETGHLIAERGSERASARRWDAVKDFVCHAPGSAASGLLAAFPGVWGAAYATGSLLGGLLLAGVMGIIWQATDRNAAA